MPTPDDAQQVLLAHLGKHLAAVKKREASMTYSIFDNGNLVASYDRARDALEAFERFLAANPDADDGLLLVAFDEHGRMIEDS